MADPLLSKMLDLGYRPYGELPSEYRDGRIVLLGDPDSGYDFPMRWDARGHNMIFQRHKVGIWVMEGGGFTWSDESPDGAPGYWRLPEALQ